MGRAWLALVLMACDGQGKFTVVGDALNTGSVNPEGTVVVDLGSLDLCINEFMPSNTFAYVDGDNSPDWIELHNPVDRPINLDGWTVTDDADEPHKHLLIGGLTILPGEYLLLIPDENPEFGPQHLNFKLDGRGEDVGLFAPDGRGSVISYGEMASDLSFARGWDCCDEPDCWEVQFGGTPGRSNTSETAIPPDVVIEDIIVEGESWRYEDSGVELDATWTSLAFDDTLWSEGVGPLGYGDSHIETTVSYGPNANNKYATTYFRREFEVTDLSMIEEVEIGLLRDDGAVVWVNQEEVVRSNMPVGEITWSTLASSTTQLETTYYVYEVPTEWLVEGTNLIAVEVHQSSLSSSDMGFDVWMRAERPVR